MPSDRPDITEIFARMQADFVGVLPDFDPFLPRSPILGFITAEAAGVHELNGRLTRVERNAFADTADLEGLSRIGDPHGITHSVSGEKAAGVATYLGTSGTAIPDETFHVTAAGVRYQSTALATIGAGGSVSVPLEAVLVGSNANLPVSASIDLEEPISGITAAAATIETAVTGGEDPELVEDYRDRVVAHLRRREQGGTLTDFERWVFESISGGWTRVFVLKPATGSNLIQIYAVDDAGDPDGNAITRAAGDYTTAFDYIDADHRRPLCADVQVDAPTLIDLDPLITLTPNTTAVQDAVKAEIVEFLIRAQTTTGTPPPKSALDEAISRAGGETDHTTTSAVPSLSSDELLVIGTPVFS